MDFTQKALTGKAEKQEKGIMGMKFMRKAEQIEKDQTKADTLQAISQLKSSTIAKKFGVQALEVPQHV
jgi:U3 small nucleolar RNA-associated protein 14